MPGVDTKRPLVLPPSVAEITVPSASLLVIRATPFELLTRPGPGRLIEFIGALAIADNGTAYVVGTNDLAIRYKAGTGDIISQTIDTAGVREQTTDIFTDVPTHVTASHTPMAH